jgi:antitoxin YefM
MASASTLKEVILMKTLSLSEVKMKLSGLVEAVQATDEEIVITKNGKPAAVLVSPDEFESWRETNTVRSDPALMEEIRFGLKERREKKTRLYTLDELLTDPGNSAD